MGPREGRTQIPAQPLPVLVTLSKLLTLSVSVSVFDWYPLDKIIEFTRFCEDELGDCLPGSANVASEERHWLHGRLAWWFRAMGIRYK